ncbi:hypothetical protein QQ045_028716 [Rhodiola kirilowii]
MSRMFETLLIILLSSLIASAAANVPMAKPNCTETCGNITIPYPFGMGNPNCYLNPWFEITCNNTSVRRPFLHKFNLEVLDFGVYFNSTAFNTTLLVVNHPIYSTCRDGISWNSTDLRGSPFIFSSISNVFVTVGCENILMMNPRKEVLAGCTSTCRGERPKSNGRCYGINFCQNSISSDVDFYSLTSTVNASDCTYAFLGLNSWFHYTNFSADLFASMNQDHVPVSLDWGTQVIVNAIPTSTKAATTINVGTLIGGVLIVISVVFCFGMYKIIKRRRKQKLKKKFFKRNGGLLLQQQLSSNEDSFDTTKIFTVKELEKATHNFNISGVLGQGGQGTVYKGMLTDGMIVAVKKSTLVHERQVEQFINEVVILSQINHRNIVKLLGCCLETEVPLLVYEYISNGTLSQLIRGQADEFPLSWEMGLQIASEISGALTYLHSASSIPIYHMDIKSSNILLDDKYRAKVADFGTSRSVAIDQTHITTNVQGTFGYLDPEFFQSSQFTDKSDVYSFGVVLAELLTREKPIISRAGEDEISLAALFISALEKDSLFDIIDERVAREGSKDEVMALAILARRCLNLNGRQRPTMREVMFEIERLRMSHIPYNASKKFHHVQSISKINKKVEDDFTSTPFPDYTGSPSSEFDIAR